MTSFQSPDETGSETGRLLPRKLADDVFWLGDCQLVPLPDGSIEHSYSSTFLGGGRGPGMWLRIRIPRWTSAFELDLDEDRRRPAAIRHVVLRTDSADVRSTSFLLHLARRAVGLGDLERAAGDRHDDIVELVTMVARVVSRLE